MDFSKQLKKVIRNNYPSVKIDDSLDIAIRIMAENNASALLVKQDDTLTGIITISDIMFSLANEEDPQNIKVSAFMTSCELITTQRNKTPCVQLDEDENILSAIKVMNEAGVNHILVSGSRGEPAGMVSSLEIIKQLLS